MACLTGRAGSSALRWDGRRAQGTTGSGEDERPCVDQQGRRDHALHERGLTALPVAADSQHRVQYVGHPEGEPDLRVPTDDLSVLGPVGRVASGTGDEALL